MKMLEILNQYELIKDKYKYCFYFRYVFQQKTKTCHLKLLDQANYYKIVTDKKEKTAYRKI